MQNYWILVDELRKIPSKYFWRVFKQFLDRIISESHPEIELLRTKFDSMESIIREKEKNALEVLIPIFEDIEQIMKKAKRKDDQMISTRQLISGEYRSTEPLARSVYHCIRYVVEGNLDLFSKKYSNILTTEKGGVTYVEYKKFREIYPAYFEFDNYLSNFEEEIEYLPEYALYRLESDREAFSILSGDEIDSYARPIILKDLILLINFIEYPHNRMTQTSRYEDMSNFYASRTGISISLRDGRLIYKDKSYTFNPSWNSFKFLFALVKSKPPLSKADLARAVSLGIKVDPESFNDYSAWDFRQTKQNLKRDLVKIGLTEADAKIITKRIDSIEGYGYQFDKSNP